MGDHNLVTTCNFHGQEYLFKMNILGNNLEILITDKSSGEEWQCSYDATYIENLTHKTGNFKQFDIFVAMLKSGLLRTSESVSLDLLTFEDLELLRSRKITKSVGPNNNNRRYLIVTYVVEFDKIRYPLPLEYCGPPDPVILQSTIRRLEVELAKTKEELTLKNNNSDSRKIYFLQKRVDELTEENLELQEEIRHLSKLAGKKPRTQVLSLQKAVGSLEQCVVSERKSHHELVEKLRNDKDQLAKELERVRCSERNLKSKLNKVSQNSRMGIGDHQYCPTKRTSAQSVRTMYKRSQSPVFQECIDSKTDLAPYTRAKSKPRRSWNQPRLSKSLTKYNLSKGSSNASTRYADAELAEVRSNRSRTSSAEPKRKTRSRCSSVESRASSGTSSKASKSSNKGKQSEYKKLEEQIANLQRMLAEKCHT